MRVLSAEKAGIYFHIPFCKSKCPYCDFYSVTSTGFDAYIAAAAREAQSFPRFEANSVYFGGGTPSLLSPEQLERLLNAARSRFLLAEDSEITLELNPADCSRDKLRELRGLGVNRLSTGVQSPFDDTLQKLGRRHTAKEALRAIDDALAAGFENISTDLMLGVPDMTAASAAESARILCTTGARHVSAYMLGIFDGTPFALRPRSDFPDDDAVADQYDSALAELRKKGFPRYEFSNFAVPGFESRHNLKYWRCADYAGIGPAAHSSVCGKRYSFPRDLARFVKTDFAEDDLSPLQDEGDVTQEDLIVCSLRTERGLDERELLERAGFVFSAEKLAAIERFRRAGLLTRENGVIRLTDRGMPVQNGIMSELI